MSALTSAQKLEYCLTCTKRRVTFKEGTICSLTNKKPEFETSCPFYEMDEQAYHERVEQMKLREARDLAEATGGLSEYGIKDPKIAGFVLIGISLAGSLFLFVVAQRVSLFLCVMFVVGLLVLAGIIRPKKE